MFWIHLSTSRLPNKIVRRMGEPENGYEQKVVCIDTGRTCTVDALFLRPAISNDWSIKH
jgi:hypothetical protein